jgi:hypothetical protein
MKSHAEEREFTVRVVFRCEFPEDYEGDLDGYEWAKDVPAVAADVVRAAALALRNRPGWTLTTSNRGRSPDDEVTLELTRVHR